MTEERSGNHGGIQRILRVPEGIQPEENTEHPKNNKSTIMRPNVEFWSIASIFELASPHLLIISDTTYS